MAKNWLKASTGGVGLEPADVPTKPGTPTTAAVPAPSMHAVAAGEGETACGRRVDELGLTVMEHAWDVGADDEHRCRECVAAVNADLAA
jgi:hypothetical protein